MHIRADVRTPEKAAGGLTTRFAITVYELRLWMCLVGSYDKTICTDLNLSRSSGRINARIDRMTLSFITGIERSCVLPSVAICRERHNEREFSAVHDVIL